MTFVFLFCTERSGSNLLTSVANGHAAISGPPPSHMFRLFGLNHRLYDPLDDYDNWQAFLDDFSQAAASMLGDWNTKFSLEELREATEVGSIKSAFEFMYGRECESDQAEIAFVKENHTYAFSHFLTSHWAQAKYVHLVRDPRDVAASWVKTDSIPGGVEKAITIWEKDQRLTLTAIKNMEEPEKVLRMRYEDLLRDEQASAERLCRHMNLEWDAGMLSYHLNSRTQRNGNKIEAWNNLKYPIMKNNQGKFRDVLSSEDIEYIELKCADLMAEFEYEPLTATADFSSVERDRRLAELSAKLSPGNTLRIATAVELETRNKRQGVIDRVLSRQQR